MRIKIISLNVWNGGRVWDNMIQFLRKENPDVLMLQEVFDSEHRGPEQRFRTTTELRTLLQYPHDTFAPTFTNTVEIGAVEEGLAIFSHFPITTTHHEYYFGKHTLRTHDSPETYKVTPRMIQHATIDMNGSVFNIFNTHGVWGEHGEDTPERLAMGKYIANAVAGKPRTILGGDFNVSPSTQTIGYIEEKLSNVLKGMVSSTFNMKYKNNPGYATAIADMLFASTDLTIVDKKVYPVDVSDHLPIMIEVE